MLIQEILDIKGHAVCTIGPEATLADVAIELVKHKIGCAVDLPARRRRARWSCWASSPSATSSISSPAPRNIRPHVPVAEIMTKDIISAAPGDSVEQLFGVITAKRIRHLPVLHDGRLVGIVSIGDLVKAQHDRLAMENRFMKDYIVS